MRGRLRGVIAIGWVFAANAGCGSDVSVQLLPGDNQALTIGDAAAKDMGAAVIDSGCQDGDPCSTGPALSFHGPYDHVEIPDSPLLDVPQDFAIEAWVLVRSYSGGHGVLNRWIAAIEDIQLTFGVPEPIKFAELPSTEPVPSHVLATWGFVKPDLWITTIAPTRPSVGVWHHLASSYGGGSLRLYVDGKRVGSMDSTEKIANGGNSLFIGATSRSEHAFDPSLGTSWWGPIDGYIAEVRISSKNRYMADFVPEPRLTPDTSTIGLWHLDEASGNVAVDSGPNHMNGTIVGAEWLRASAR